jgi:hypothetical protein
VLFLLDKSKTKHIYIILFLFCQKINKNGHTALHFAAFSQSIDSVRLVSFLLDRGLDIDKMTSNCENALTLAVSVGSLELINLLLDRGANINCEKYPEEVCGCVGYISVACC